MDAFFLPIPKRILLIFLLPLLFSCTSRDNIVHPSFYFWKSGFELTSKEQATLHNLNTKQLYVKFFDVEWNEANRQPAPVAVIRFKDSSTRKLPITPVVFITNETIDQADSAEIQRLSNNIVKLIQSIAQNNKLLLTKEIQIDCDWTGRTKDKYFQLLQNIRKHSFFKGKMMSATIRLHQLKFISTNGVPPVEKGLLMCYNMGNLKDPKTSNSILDVDELKKYTNNLTKYPLPLDIALPLFDWYVWFDGMRYKGLLHTFPNEKNNSRIMFERDTVAKGISFRKGEWLRYEGSSMDDLQQVSKHLIQKLKNKEFNLIFYHLDERLLSKYEQNELETIVDGFR